MINRSERAQKLNEALLFSNIAHFTVQVRVPDVLDYRLDPLLGRRDDRDMSSVLE